MGPGGSPRWFWWTKCWDILPTPGSIPASRGKGRLELQADRKGVTDRFVRGMYKRPQPEDYLQRVMAASLRVPTNTAVTLGASFAAVGDWRKILPDIDRPLLFVVTEPQRKQAEGVSADVPSARVEVFEQAGHALFVDEPDRFNRLLEDFLIQAGLGPANTCSLLGRDDGKKQVRGVLGGMMDGLPGRPGGCAGAERLARVGVAVELGKVAAGHVQADAVSGLKGVAGVDQVDGEGVDPVFLKRLRAVSDRRGSGPARFPRRR